MGSISDHVFWEDQQPIKKINNTFTPTQVQSLLTRVLLELNNDKLESEIVELKEYLKAKL